METDPAQTLERLHFITLMIDQIYDKMKEVQKEGVDVEQRLGKLIEILNDMQKKILMIVRTSPTGITCGYTVYRDAIKQI